MPYAEGRVYHDADSHIMELPDWIEGYADPKVREKLRPLYLGRAGKLAEDAVSDASERRDDPARAADAEASLMKRKGWSGLGAFDPSERSRAMDLLGFDSQLVFSTFAGLQFLGDDLELALGGLTAHNRAITDFCSDDKRLLAVGMAGWHGPDNTLGTVIEALDLGAKAILFPSHPGEGISPTHPDYDAVWATLEERGIPFLLHIGGGGRPVKQAFHDNGRPVTDFLGGGENVRSRDYMAIHQLPEQFLSSMILDGVLDDHPNLKGGSIEQGALWLPGFMRLIDACQATFRKTEPRIQALELRASDYVHRQLFVTPFVREDIGWLVESCGDDVLLFSSDFPHPEGSKDPIRHFEDTMQGLSTTARDNFYEHNFVEMMGAGLT